MTEPAMVHDPQAISCRTAGSDDGSAISRIHGEGLTSGHASFRETPYPAEEAWRAEGPGLVRVAMLGTAITGWASVTPTSDRCTYAGVGEVSLYVGQAFRKRGIGAVLLADLITESEAAGFWTLTAQIFPENRASLTLFARHGFERLGIRRGLGRMSHGPMAGQWRDVLMLERRSSVVGVDPLPA